MIKMHNIKKTFGKKDAAVQALNGISLEINQGEMIAIMGKSGSGKSTLLNIMGGLISMDSGEYMFDENPVDFNSQKSLAGFRRDKIGFIVQYFALINDINVFENIALPLNYQKRKQKDIKNKVNETLKKLEIEEKSKSYPDELSGGQQQRVSIARAIVKDPFVILADEPTGALDEETEDRVLDIFDRLHQEGRTIVIVTHDQKVADRCDRIIFLRDGMLAQEV